MATEWAQDSQNGEDGTAQPALPGGLRLASIVDVAAIQSLMDQFYQISRVPMSIIDLKGEVLIGVGWQRVCLDFHRAHPQTCTHCLESDAQLTEGVTQGEVKLYKCKNGMWDMVTPIHIGNEKVGNVFSGQFFFDDEEPDREFFLNQARKYGFDAQDYLAAIDEAPRLSRHIVDTGMAFLKDLANLLSSLSFTNLELVLAVTARDELMESLRSSRDELVRAQAVGRVGTWRLDTRTNLLSWSDEAYRIFGVPAGTSMTYDSFLDFVHPEDREYVIARWSAALTGALYDIEHRIVVNDEVKWVSQQAELDVGADGILRGGFGIVQDITERKRHEQRLMEERREILLANRLFGLFVEEETDRLYERALDILLEATSSTQGVFGYVDEEGFLACPTMTRIFDECEMPDKDKCVIYQRDQWTGLWGKALRENRILVNNNPAGVPKGHVPIENNLAVPVTFQGKPIGLVNLANRPDGYSEDIAAFVGRLCERMAPALYAWMQRDLLAREREAVAALVAERHRLADCLNRLSAEISATFEPGVIYNALAARGADMLETDFGAVLVRDNGAWVVRAIAGSAPVSEGDAFSGEELGLPEVVRETGYHIQDASTDPLLAHTPLPRMEVRAVHAIPVLVEGRPGVWLAFGSRHSVERFSDLCIEYANRLKSVAKVALQAARVYQREHRIAETLQAAILTPPEEVPGLAISYLYRPASATVNVGGDFYDAFLLPDGRAAILVGDVSGKGLDAARFTTLMRDGVRAYLLEGAGPSEVFRRLNRLAYRFSPISHFATAFLGILDVSTGHMEYCGAGHPSALLVSPERCSPLQSHSALIGAFEDGSYYCQEAVLGHDDVLVLYTDGVTEARQGSALYGEERLAGACERLRGARIEDMPNLLLQGVLEFSQGELADDVIVLCLSRTEEAEG